MASALVPRYSSASLLSRIPHTHTHLRARPAPLPSPSRCLYRPFSQTARRGAVGKVMQGQPKSRSVLSNKNQLKKATASSSAETIADDMGILPGTFIRPLWRNRPSIFKEPKRRLQMEWLNIKMKIQNFAGVLVYCKYLNRQKKLPLRYRERKPRALHLHQVMYTAFAAGDISSLKKLCCTGLLENFSRNISKRPRGSPPLTWTLHKYRRFPLALTFSGARVISDRAAALPGANGFGIRQAIVRIQSRQSLVEAPAPAPVSQQPQRVQNRVIGKQQQQQQQEVTKAEAEKKAIEKQKDCTEYVVLQRFMVNGEEGEWKVWGLAEETTAEVLETDKSFEPGLSLVERFRAIWTQFK
ncbi:hypothetical protein FQN55_000103 [Onygenales sp. PD_40]|nr:hypothetical protein FQN55_000103 [Onygenales sp. PD_40]KAK2783248.1 hypothetical protein FQN52_000349 [Onygenales sp. PD_12]